MQKYFYKNEFLGLFWHRNRSKNAYLKPIILKEKLQFQCVYRFKTRDITKNFSQIDCMQLIEQFLNKEFKMQFYLQQKMIGIMRILMKKNST